MTRAPSPRRASEKKAAPAPKRRVKTQASTAKPSKARATSRRVAPVAPLPVVVPPPSPAEREATFKAAWQPQLDRLEPRSLTAVSGIAVWVATPRLAKPAWVLGTTGLWSKGVELTLRVPRAKEDVGPPPWALALLSMVIEDVLEGQVPGPNLSLGFDRGLEGAAEITGCTFTTEPLLPGVATPHVQVTALLVVGLATDEVRLVREWNPASLVEVLTKVDGALLTDPDRASMLISPRARTQIEQRVEREGSSLQVMRAVVSKVSASTWTLSTEAVPTFIGLLKGRLAHQRTFSVQGPDVLLQVVPADVPSFTVGAQPVLKLSQTGARQLRSQLRARPGRYELDALPGFTLEVV
jgi:hypothetical protein